MFGNWPEIIRQWKRDAAGPFWKRRRINWEEAEALFRSYLKDGYRDCPTWKYLSSAEGVELTAPWEQLLKIRLTGAGLSESEVLNGYLPSRWYDYFTVCELRQLDTCRDPLKWKKVFYTHRDAEALGGNE